MPNTEQVAVVAGVGPGLGRALCRRLVAEGYRVAGLARSPDAGLAPDLAGRMHLLACDLTRQEPVKRGFERIDAELGPVRVLVYNAGRFGMSPFAETSADDFHALWEVNCYGAFLCAREAVPRMLAAGGGTVVFTGATASVKAGGRFAAFGASKFALRGMAQAMARELGPQGIHVAHVVIDGVMWTPRTRAMMDISEDACLIPEDVADTYLSLIRQPRSAWTCELDLRPDREPF
jgi:NAD(P)-dependent dehydrogenase (short-subunit alcohol dehydrogenase family)